MQTLGTMAPLRSNAIHTPDPICKRAIYAAGFDGSNYSESSQVSPVRGTPNIACDSRDTSLNPEAS